MTKLITTAAAAAAAVALATPAFADAALASWNIDALANVDAATVADTVFTPLRIVGEGFDGASEWVAEQLPKL